MENAINCKYWPTERLVATTHQPQVELLQDQLVFRLGSSISFVCNINALLKLPTHIRIILPLPVFTRILKLCHQVVRLIGQIFDGRRQDFYGGDCRIVGLYLEVNIVDKRVGMVVSSKAHGGVSQKLHAKEIANRVVLLVEAKGPGVCDLQSAQKNDVVCEKRRLAYRARTVQQTKEGNKTKS